MRHTFLLAVSIGVLASFPVAAEEHGRQRRNGGVQGQVAVIFGDGLATYDPYYGSYRGCWDCGGPSWNDSKGWQKDRREAWRDRRKDLREAWREAEKDRREAAREWEKAEREAWREEQKARAEWERERAKAEREAAREWLKHQRRN